MVNAAAVSEGSTNDALFYKFADADINTIAGVESRFRYMCGNTVSYVSRSGGWTSLRDKGSWTIDRNMDGIDDCTATRTGYIFSDYSGTPLYTNAQCSVDTHQNFGESSTNLGCYVNTQGWGYRATVWVGAVVPAPQSSNDGTALYGTLRVRFISVNDFDLAYNDAGSGSDIDGAFYNPTSNALARNPGYYFLGSFGYTSYSSPINSWIVLVRNEGNATGVVAATSFTKVYDDTGSGAYRSGAFWRPVCPVGYVPMGILAFVGYSTPTGPVSSRVGCVQSRLTSPAGVGPVIWLDKGSGASANFGSWQSIVPPTLMISNDYIAITPNTFGGYNAYSLSPDAPLPEMNILVLPVSRSEYIAPKNTRPKLDATSYLNPTENSDATAFLRVIVPFFAAGTVDYKYPTTVDRINFSPFYMIERMEQWQLAALYVNDDFQEINEERAVTVGSSSQDTEEVIQTIGVSSSVTSGGSVWAVEATITVSYEFSTSRTTSQTMYREVTISREYHVPPFCSFVEYNKRTLFNVYRLNGDLVRRSAPVSSDEFARSTFDFSPFKICSYSENSGLPASAAPMLTLSLLTYDQAVLQCHNLPYCKGFSVNTRFNPNTLTPIEVRFYTKSLDVTSLAASATGLTFTESACADPADNNLGKSLEIPEHKHKLSTAALSASIAAVAFGCMVVIAIVVGVKRKYARKPLASLDETPVA
jgi:hypothetical protein